MNNFKIILGTIAVFGTLMQGVELYFSPDTLLLESSAQYPEQLYWIRWVITLIAVLGYFLMDYKENKNKKLL